MSRYTTAGNVWQIQLSHDEVDKIAGSGGTAAGIVAGGAEPLAVVLGAIAGVLVAVDQVGGGQGVNVVGVFGTQLVTVTPAAFSPVKLVKSFADALIHETGLPDGVVGAGIGAGVALLAVGPAGVVIGGVAGALGATVFDNGGPNPGDVYADRRAAGPWETFFLVSLGTPETKEETLGDKLRKPFPSGREGGVRWSRQAPAERPTTVFRPGQVGEARWARGTLGDKLRRPLHPTPPPAPSPPPPAAPPAPPPASVAVGSWRGYFSAESGGGAAVHANRREIGPWESAELIHNDNGTVSLRMAGGHFLTAESGGGDGSVCNWNRTEIGPWEQFWMEYQEAGTFALKTFSQGTYVSVQ